MPTLEISTRDRSIALLIFGFLLACYLVTYTGTIQSSDGLAMFATVESMVRRGEIDANQLLWMDLQQGSYGPDGELYSRKGLGMPLLALPLVWVANLWSSIGLVQAALLLNPLLTAWTGGLIYRTGRRLGWVPAAAMMTALTFGLATLAWPYTQTFFSDPVAAWGLFGAFYGMLSYRQTGRKRYLMLGGLAWGLAYLSRVINLVTLPIYLILLVTVILRSVHRTLFPHPLTNLYSLVVYNWRAFTSFLLPVGIAGLTSLWWNWVRFGSIFDSGYVESESFSADWLFGISGLLIGPARGVLWYVPVLILAIPGMLWFWRNKRWILYIFLALAGVYVLLYGKWYMWHGGFSWGPRFLVGVLPFLALLTGPIFESLLSPAAHTAKALYSRIAGFAVGVVVTLSIGVQWLGMLAPFSLVQNWLAGAVEPLFAPVTFTQIAYSPLLLQWQFLSAQAVPFAWWSVGDRLSIDWFGLLIASVGVVVGLILILRQTVLPVNASPQEKDEDSSGAHLPNVTGEHTNFPEPGGPQYWVYSSALLILMLALLTRYNSTLSHPVMAAAAEQIESHAEAGDAILHLEPLLTQPFADRYHGTLPTYGLFNRDELTQSDQRWLEHLRQSYTRIWIIAPPGLPESSQWERVLRQDEFLLDHGLIEGLGDFRVPLYGLTKRNSLIDHGSGAIFGPKDEGEPTLENGLIRLNGYATIRETEPEGEVLLILRWEGLVPVAYDYHVFVHILSPDGDLIAQRDGQPVQWMRPTSTWEEGEFIIDRYGLLLPEGATAGLYGIRIGLYDPVSGQRLPVNTGTVESAVELEPFVVNP
ncbi:MAG: hypothetical protein AAF702_30135 [Chloroflexota bacterium]